MTVILNYQGCLKLTKSNQLEPVVVLRSEKTGNPRWLYRRNLNMLVTDVSDKDRLKEIYKLFFKPEKFKFISAEKIPLLLKPYEALSLIPSDFSDILNKAPKICSRERVIYFNLLEIAENIQERVLYLSWTENVDDVQQQLHQRKKEISEIKHSLSESPD